MFIWAFNCNRFCTECLHQSIRCRGGSCPVCRGNVEWKQCKKFRKLEKEIERVEVTCKYCYTKVIHSLRVFRQLIIILYYWFLGCSCTLQYAFVLMSNASCTLTHSLQTSRENVTTHPKVCTHVVYMSLIHIDTYIPAVVSLTELLFLAPFVIHLILIVRD